MSKPDAFVGGALNKDDLLEILQMEIETVSVKSKSPDGVTRDDLKPLVKAISDLRSVGLGGHDAVKKAVAIQMSMTRQLVIQQDVKTALINKKYEEMKAAVEKAKSIQLKTKQCKELESELVKLQKEMLKRVTEENQKLKKLQTPTPAPPQQQHSGGDDKSQSSSTNATPSGRFFFKKATATPPPMSADDHQITDGRSSSSGKASSFSKRLFGGGSGKAAPSAQQQQQPPPPPVSDEVVDPSAPGAHQQPPSVFQELHRQAQYDLLVEAMMRVKLVLDEDGKTAPGSILKAAGDDVELVTGDQSTVHIWLGDYHGVVKSSASMVNIANSKTTFVGEIDSKNSENKWEIRMAVGTSAPVSSSTSNKDLEALKQQIANLENELRAAKDTHGGGNVRQAGEGIKALLNERNDSIAFEKKEEMRAETSRRRLISESDRVDGDMKDMSAQVLTMSQEDMSLPIDVMTVKELKAYVLEKGGSIVGVTEKEELVKIATQLRETAAQQQPPSPAKPTAAAVVAAAPSPKAASPAKPETAAAAAESEEEAEEKEDDGLMWKDHEQYGKYFRMLKVGLNKDTVKHKIKQDGLDPTIMDLDPESLVKDKPKSAAEILEPYLKMIRFGVPRAVVEYKMKSQGLDPALLDGGEGGGDEEEMDIPRLTIKICEDERFIPFLKMLGFGVPKDAVKIKMQTKGLDGDILDMDPNDFSPVDGTNVKRKSSKKQAPKIRKKKDDGHQWKKLFWQAIKVTDPASKQGIWSKDMGFDLVDNEKHEIKQWFALKINNNTADQAAATAAKSAKPETVQVLEGARAQNVSILLSKFRIQISDLKRMICTMKVSDEFDLSSDDVKSILSMLPTSEEAEKLNKVEKKETLGAAEKHFLGILEIPRFKQRIACFLFKLQFNEIKRDLEFDLDILGKAVLEVLNSTKLARLFSVILALGNYLNSMGGLLNEEEDGFQPVRAFKLTSSLAKIKLSKAHGSARNMLNFLETVLFKRQKHVLDYVLHEVDGIRAASTVVLSNVKAQVKGLAMGVKELENEVNYAESVRADAEQSKKITPEDELFFTAVEGFFQKARRDVHDLSVAMNEVDANFTELLQYVREDAETTPEVLFKALVQFFDEVHVAHEENTVARLKAQKLLGTAAAPAVEEEESVKEQRDALSFVDDLNDGFGAVETTRDLEVVTPPAADVEQQEPTPVEPAAAAVEPKAEPPAAAAVEPKAEPAAGNDFEVDFLDQNDDFFAVEETLDTVQPIMMTATTAAQAAGGEEPTEKDLELV